MGLNRPNPARWLWYALGGRLPEAHREWVLHDVTTGTWIWRHAARSTVVIAPLASVWLLLPGPLGLRLALVVLATIVAYFYSMAYTEHSCELRLVKHGYPAGTGSRLRARANDEKEAEARARYLARYRHP
ncbi:MAG: DUF5313 family protein [Haloechinothrix sp.]